MQRSDKSDVINVAWAIGREAQIRNPALEPLRFLVGTWRTEGTHPLVPGTTFHGRTSFAWEHGGAFLIMRSEIAEPEVPSGVAIFSSDDTAGQCFMLYFDERGISRKYDVSLGDREITCRRDHPDFSQWFTIRANASGNRLSSNGEMSEHGGPWQQDLSLTYTREDEP